MSKIKVICDNCGEEFAKWESNIMEHTFCSRECSGEWHRKDRVEVECDWCGDKFTKIESEVRNNNFCSKECNNKWISNQGNTEICDWCGEEFKISPKEVKEHNFCCHEHYAKWLEGRNMGKDHPNYSLVDVRCTQCGKQFKIQKHRIERNNNFFCDYECYGRWLSQNHVGPDHPNWNGGAVNYYGPNWYSQRRKVLERDNHRCQRCNESKDNVRIEVHHIKPFKSFRLSSFQGKPVENVIKEFDWHKANKLQNLITLCAQCHREAEGKDIDKYLDH